MNLCLINHNFRYELEKLVRIFMPFEKIMFCDSEEITDLCAVTELSENGKYAFARLYIGGEIFNKKLSIDTCADDMKKEQELKLALGLYDCFTRATGYFPQWGILTGVRPAKLFSRLCKKNGLENTEDYFKNSLKVTDKKISLCKEAVNGENKITSLSRPDSFSLYISVPFCPSRCNYCSFVSHSVEQAKRLIPKYTELLCREIRETAKIAKSLNLKLKTIYIGGGTPTTLSAEQLTQVLDTVKGSFDFSDLEEYTVEAGRPDTVTKEKLLAIKSGGATRISINPQTMNDEVLKNIGRRHTVAEMIDAFHLARECGFDNINTDLIAGLSGDTFESFCHSVDEIIALDPENVTVHTLSMKRASNLTKSQTVFDLKEGETAAKMVDYARMKLIEHGIKPYYMYRQSKTVGNLENVGYAKQGYEGLYNVYIMDETHTILACGASAVIKLREIGGDNIERIFNYKYPYEYIEKFNDIIDRKQKILEFYKGILTV